MAYKEPDTAIHHLRMAQSYLDDADKLMAKEKKPNRAISEQQIGILAQAAQHLNKAREIDPNEVLWIEQGKDGEKVKLDQDGLNGDVLLSEGIAHLNAALSVTNDYKNIDGTLDKNFYRQGLGHLQQARDALEKATKYRPYSDQTYRFLAKAYSAFGDQENYRRTLERHVEISPDDIELHKQLAALETHKAPAPVVRQKPFTISAPAVFSIVMFVGFLFIILAVVVQSFGPAGFGIILLIVAALGLKFVETFG